MKKKQKMDERTRKALDTIAYGDVVRFYDCFEAQVYGDKTFRVISENPIIYQECHVLVKLQGLGQFPIGRLKKVSNEEPSMCDQEVINGLMCCDQSPPDCEKCAYNKYSPACCSQQLLHDSNVLLRRRDNFKKGVI
jgi:hypothetical protein